MSLSGPRVSEGSPSGRDVLEKVASGCLDLNDWRHLRETAQHTRLVFVDTFYEDHIYNALWEDS